MGYKIETLLGAVRDYFSAEEEWKMFLKTWTPGWWESKTAEQREKYTKYSERSQASYDKVSDMCQLIDVDMETLLAMVKAMNRWEKGHGWQYCLHVTFRTENNVRRFLENPDGWAGHYQSTGRKMAA